MFKKVLPTIAKGLLAASILAAATLPATSVFAAGNADTNTLNISGSTTVFPIVQVAITRFPNSYPGAVLNVSQGGSGAGMTAISNGTDDIAMSSSTCSDTNMTGTYKCADLTVTTIARDAVSIIYNSSLPSACIPAYLTKTDVQNIWTNTATIYWNQLSQVSASCPANTPMHIYAREIGSGTRSSLESLSGFSAATGTLSDAAEQAKITASGTRENGNPAMEAAVNGDQYGIGYVGLHFTGGSNTALALDPVSYGKTGSPVLPSDATVANNTYPMSRNLYLFTLSTAVNNKALIQEFLTWIVQPEAQAIVTNEGYLNIAAEAPDWDVNLDKTCDIGDVAVIGNNWLSTNSVTGWVRSDANYDGKVDIGDVAYVGNNWLSTWH